MGSPIEPAQTEAIISILDEANDITIATDRENGRRRRQSVLSTTVSKIYFGCAAEYEKAKNLARDNKVSLSIDLAPY
jgi:hypothetical protein